MGDDPSSTMVIVGGFTARPTAGTTQTRVATAMGPGEGTMSTYTRDSDVPPVRINPYRRRVHRIEVRLPRPAPRPTHKDARYLDFFAA